MPPTEAVPPTEAPPTEVPTDTPVSQEPPPSDDITATPEPPVLLPPTGAGNRPDLISLPVVVYVDANGNGRYDAGEGVRDLDLIFRAADGTTETRVRTSRSGTIQALVLRGVTQQVTIPYLGRTYTVTPRADGWALGFRLPTCRRGFREPARLSRVPEHLPAQAPVACQDLRQRGKGLAVQGAIPFGGLKHGYHEQSPSRSPRKRGRSDATRRILRR